MTLIDRLTGLRHRIRSIVLVMLGAGLAAVLVGLLTPTTWTARAVLTTSSERTPEQDAYLAVGYAAFFNSESYQSRLAARLPDPGQVSFDARTTANSPIVYVEATAADPAVATTAAGALATALREDVNGGLQGDVAERVRVLQGQLTPLRDRLALPIDDAERAGVQQSINSLQNQIATVRGNTTNQLKVLQLDGGVARNARPTLTDAVSGLAGGALAGILVALALDVWRPRIRDRAGVRAHLGLDTLAVLDDPGLDGRHLTEVLGLLAWGDLPGPLTLAVTGLTSTCPSSDTATRISRAWAERNGPVVLLRSPTAPGPALDDPTHPGLWDLLAHPHAPGPPVSHAGRPTVVGASGRQIPGLLTRPRVEELLHRLAEGRSAVVIDAPSVADSVADRVLCAAAGRTLVVVEAGATAAQAATTTSALRRIGADVLGAVLVRGHHPAGAPGSGVAVPTAALRNDHGTDLRVPAGHDGRD